MTNRQKKKKKERLSDVRADGSMSIFDRPSFSSLGQMCLSHTQAKQTSVEEILLAELEVADVGREIDCLQS